MGAVPNLRLIMLHSLCSHYLSSLSRITHTRQVALTDTHGVALTLMLQQPTFCLVHTKPRYPLNTLQHVFEDCTA